MKRDTDMVLRASDAHSAWWKSAEKVPTICEMMADFATDEVERQARWLRGMLAESKAQCDRWIERHNNQALAHSAAIKRAEAAEAEVSRLKEELRAAGRAYDDLKAALAKKPPEPYTPRVGDVVTWGTCVCLYRVTGFDDHGLAFVESCDRRWPERLQRRAPKGDGLRLATATELASAGLPPAPVDDPAVAKHNEWLRAAASNESPATPRVLPEHLAWMEADAAWACSSWSTDFDAPENKKRYDEAILAARALRAAVARRDGGQK